MQNNYNNKYPGQEVTYAGFWVRLGAYLIDSLIVFAGLLIVRLIVSGILSLAEGTVLAGNILFHYTLKDMILYFFHVLYFIMFTYCTGTTPGKKAMNLKVVDADGNSKLNLINIIYRETVGRFLCSITIGIGYLLVGVDREKRGLHDMLCDTRVIYGKKVKIYPVMQQGQPPIASAPPAPYYYMPGRPTEGQQPLMPHMPSQGPDTTVRDMPVQGQQEETSREQNGKDCE